MNDGRLLVVYVVSLRHHLRVKIVTQSEPRTRGRISKGTVNVLRTNRRGSRKIATSWRINKRNGLLNKNNWISCSRKSFPLFYSLHCTRIFPLHPPFTETSHTLFHVGSDPEADAEKREWFWQWVEPLIEESAKDDGNRSEWFGVGRSVARRRIHYSCFVRSFSIFLPLSEPGNLCST